MITDTERIATALLGWKYSAADPDMRVLTHPDCNGKVSFQSDDPQPFINIGRGGIRWPDFTTLDGCHLFESALENHSDCSLYAKYAAHLVRIVAGPKADNWWPVCLSAPPDVRVAACIRVLDDIGGAA